MMINEFNREHYETAIQSTMKSHLILSQFLLLLPFISSVSAIRKDGSLLEKRSCRTTVHGRYMLSDDDGYVCDALSLDPQSQCCPRKGEKFSCQGCNLNSQCCKSYEVCVSCCLNPSKTPKEQVFKMKIAKPVTAGTYSSVFDFCAGRCRHNSESVVHENAYLSDYHHCFSLQSNYSGGSKLETEARLFGINIITGRQGESCDSVCKSNGQSCVPNKLALLNECEMLQKYFSCKNGCAISLEPDQPAEIVADAPQEMNPSSCLYAHVSASLSCDGAHLYRRRICPCA
ncbi:hypothetical protein Leryth_001738 [Lithospermum erythrorhizon]|nr:hypothetical protein Leryth_001738 [Lithospermum erythrorhizon]